MKIKTKYTPAKRYVSHCAKKYWERDWLACPLAQYSKKPPHGFPLKKLLLRQDNLSLGELAAFFPNDFGGNIGVILQPSGLVVLDIDDEKEIEWMEDNFPDTPFRVRTGRGQQRFYRRKNNENNKTILGLAGRKIDVKCTGYVVAPPSIHPNGTLYKWITPLEKLDIETDMPIFDPDWLPQSEKQTESNKRPICPASQEIVDRSRKYLSKVVCISGSAAHSTLFRGVCKLVDIFKLNESQIYQLVHEWNQTNCFHADGVMPYPWSEKEIHHKIKDVLSR